MTFPKLSTSTIIGVGMVAGGAVFEALLHFAPALDPTTMTVISVVAAGAVKILLPDNAAGQLAVMRFLTNVVGEAEHKASIEAVLAQAAQDTANLTATGVIPASVIGDATAAPASPAVTTTTATVATVTTDVKAALGALVLVVGACSLTVACTAQQIATASNAVAAAGVKAASLPAGQLFCKIDAAAGSEIVAVIEDGLSALVPFAAPISILATGASAKFVADTCAKAGTNGTPVPPPDLSSSVPVVPVTPPIED